MKKLSFEHTLATVLGALLAICLGLVFLAPSTIGLYAAPQLTTTPTFTPYQGHNLVQNGTFSNGTSDWYQVGMTGSVTAGTYCGGFATSGTNPWDVIFGSQSAINVEQGHSYRLSFTARADTASNLRVVLNQNAAPWAVYFVQDLAVTTTNQSFTYTFSMAAASDAFAALAFQFGGQPANNYCLDDVVLEELITMTNTPSPTSPMSTPLPGPNLIPNGNFSNGTGNWYQVGIAGITSNGEYCGVVSNAGSNPWDVILGSTARFAIENGHTYRLSFQAHALADTSMRVLVSMDHTPWAVYFVSNPSLTGAVQVFSYTFTMTQASDTSSTFAIQIGTQAPTTYCFSDIQLYDLNGSTSTPTATAAGTATPTPNSTPSPTAVPTSVGMYGRVTPKQWYQGRKSAITLTFDDGYKSQVTQLLPVLNNFQFHSTFFIASNSLTWGGNYGSITDFAQVLTGGHEIGSQSVTDNALTGKPIGDVNTSGTLLYELVHSKETLESSFPTNDPIISFAYSFGAYNNTVTQHTGQYYQSARALGNTANSASPSPSEWLTLGSYGIDFGNLAVRTSPAADDPELANTQSWLQNSVIAPGKWGVFLFHEVVPFANLATTTSWQPATIEWLTDLANWIQPQMASKDVWVATFGNVTRYAKERDALRTWVTSESAERIEIQVTDSLPDVLFHHPLTVEITVPSDWKKVLVSTSTTPVSVDSITANGRTYIEVEIDPTAGALTLQNATPPSYQHYLPVVVR